MLQGVDCWVGKRNASETTKLRSDLPYRIDQGHRQRVGSDRSVCVCVFTPGPGLGLGAHGIPSVASTFADHIWFARGSASVGRAWLQRRGGTKSCVQQCTKTPDEKFDMEYMQRMCCFLKWRFCFLRQNCSRCFLETQHAGQEAEELASDRPNAVLNVVPAWPAEFVGFHEAKCSVICGEMASRESSRPPVEH